MLNQMLPIPPHPPFEKACLLFLCVCVCVCGLNSRNLFFHTFGHCKVLARLVSSQASVLSLSPHGLPSVHICVLIAPSYRDISHMC